MKKYLPKIYIILGPTASGKSELAVKLAKKINGEIVSADSRQIYTYLNIGSNKITTKEMNGIQHYCLDITDPIKISKKYLKEYKNFSVKEYLKFADQAIKNILIKNKTPIICGGTGFYIDAIIYGLAKNVKPNPILRLKLEKKNLEELLEIIQKLNYEKYLELINNSNSSERNNKRRLIRIIEILSIKKEIAPKRNKLKYEIKFIFLEKEKEDLQKRIHDRLIKKLTAKGKNNLIYEIKYLLKDLKINPEWLIKLGLEYKYVTLYVQNKITYEKMIGEIKNKTWQYAKRQILWNKKYKNKLEK